MITKIASILLAIALVPSVAPVAAGDEGPVPDGVLARGKQLYQEARDPDSEAEVMARIGGDKGVEIPAWTLPCVTCHGTDARGGLPGQEVTPPDIRWSALRAPATTEAGRERPAYDDAESIGRAVIDGVDAGDQPLSTVMPRYRLNAEQWAALAAYLRSLDEAEAETAF